MISLRHVFVLLILISVFCALLKFPTPTATTLAALLSFLLICFGIAFLIGSKGARRSFWLTYITVFAICLAGLTSHSPFNETFNLWSAFFTRMHQTSKLDSMVTNGSEQSDIANRRFAYRRI